MKKPKNHFYVVWLGHTPGIYTSWDKCRKQTEGFAGAKYKGFATEAEAEEALGAGYEVYYNNVPRIHYNAELRQLVGEPLREAICVDAACSGNPGALEYRGVNMLTGKEIFHRGPFPQGTTNIGEFLAIVTGLAWLKQNSCDFPIYSDSRNGIKWVKQKRINTKLEHNEFTAPLFEIVEKALQWLHANGISNQLLKWETEAWGEIPADFGRK